MGCPCIESKENTCEDEYAMIGQAGGDVTTSAAIQGEGTFSRALRGGLSLGPSLSWYDASGWIRMPAAPGYNLTNSRRASVWVRARREKECIGGKKRRWVPWKDPSQSLGRLSKLKARRMLLLCAPTTKFRMIILFEPFCFRS